MLTLYTFDGGPAVNTVRNARVAGLVETDVARVVLVMSDGSRLSTTLVEPNTTAVLGHDYRAFASTLSDSYYESGISLSAVVGYDAADNLVQEDKYDNVLPG